MSFCHIYNIDIIFPLSLQDGYVCIVLPYYDGGDM
jgi:hypothetical protein